MHVSFYVIHWGGARASVFVIIIVVWMPHPQILTHTLGLFIINLLIKATTTPAPIGSTTVGIT